MAELKPMFNLANALNDIEEEQKIGSKFRSITKYLVTILENKSLFVDYSNRSGYSSLDARFVALAEAIDGLKELFPFDVGGTKKITFSDLGYDGPMYALATIEGKTVTLSFSESTDIQFTIGERKEGDLAFVTLSVQDEDVKVAIFLGTTGTEDEEDEEDLDDDDEDNKGVYDYKKRNDGYEVTLPTKSLGLLSARSNSDGSLIFEQGSDKIVLLNDPSTIQSVKAWLSELHEI